ncbi:hypothetical protein ACFFK7_10410 [Pseudoalteromonas xiamenensis]|uniref:hypothetical protein n=1 Tax=Pseudoalteromonas xiamenensis TaxID=882626 RepID=UPI0035E7E3AE
MQFSKKETRLIKEQFDAWLNQRGDDISLSEVFDAKTALTKELFFKHVLVHKCMYSSIFKATSTEVQPELERRLAEATETFSSSHVCKLSGEKIAERMVVAFEQKLRPSSAKKLAGTIMDIARWLDQFEKDAALILTINRYTSSPLTRNRLPLVLCTRIRGLSFQNACLMLANIGFHDFGSVNKSTLQRLHELGLIPTESPTAQLPIIALETIQAIRLW